MPTDAADLRSRLLDRLGWPLECEVEEALAEIDRLKRKLASAREDAVRIKGWWDEAEQARAADLVDLRAAAQDLHDLARKMEQPATAAAYLLSAARVERVIARINHRAGETAPAPLPCRDDAVAGWLKAAPWDLARWNVLDNLLDDYRLHADTGTPLDQHACYGPHCCDHPATPTPEPAELHQHRFLEEDPSTVSCACGERGQLIDGGCATNPEPAEETP